jgi:ankyrin repeat protein
MSQYRVRLFQAISEGSIEDAKVILAENNNEHVDLDDSNRKTTSLMLAVDRSLADIEFSEIVSLLLEKGADPLREDKGGKSAFARATEKPGNIAIITMLLDALPKYKPTQTGIAYVNTLAMAIGANDTPIINMLLDKIDNIAQIPGNAERAILAALDAGNDTVMSALIDKGAKIHDVARYHAAIKKVVYADNVRMIDTLIKAFPEDGGVYSANDPGSPLQIGLIDAIQAGKAHLVQKFIDAGADVNQVTQNGELALIEAAGAEYQKIQQELHVQGLTPKNKLPPIEVLQTDRVSIIKLLLAAGAKVNQPSDRGELALLEAARSNYGDIVTILLKAGANVNSQGNGGDRTALSFAAGKGNLAMAKELLERDAQVNLPDGNGRTPLIEAVRQGDVNMVELLIKNGAYVNIRDNSGQTPLISALASNDPKAMVGLLLQKGAYINMKDEGGLTIKDYVADQKAHSAGKSRSNLKGIKKDIADSGIAPEIRELLQQYEAGALSQTLESAAVNTSGFINRIRNPQTIKAR